MVPHQPLVIMLYLVIKRVDLGGVECANCHNSTVLLKVGPMLKGGSPGFGSSHQWEYVPVLKFCRIPALQIDIRVLAFSVVLKPTQK